MHEGTYSELAKRPYVWATWVWNMFDFASSWRNEGNARGINDKGLVTYDRRSEEHTSELQSPVPISYAVFCFLLL